MTCFQNGEVKTNRMTSLANKHVTCYLLNNNTVTVSFLKRCHIFSDNWPTGYFRIRGSLRTSPVIPNGCFQTHLCPNSSIKKHTPRETQHCETEL
jgi:hypothetical protein